MYMYVHHLNGEVTLSSLCTNTLSISLNPCMHSSPQPTHNYVHILTSSLYLPQVRGVGKSSKIGGRMCAMHDWACANILVSVVTHG
jgi:hypothetical protein